MINDGFVELSRNRDMFLQIEANSVSTTRVRHEGFPLLHFKSFSFVPL